MSEADPEHALTEDLLLPEPVCDECQGTGKIYVAGHVSGRVYLLNCANC